MNTPINTESELAIRRSNGTFGPGNVANPGGRPKGSVGGRQRTLQLLDSIINEPDNIEALRQAMAKAMLEDPMKFFRQIIMPLLPTEARHEIATPGFSWISLPDVIRKHNAARSKSSEVKT